MPRLATALLALPLLAPLLAAAPAAAQDLCDEMWSERNAIYKDAGYCFRTARAIRAFSCGFSQ